jgi:2-dehydropantoate 2-reductase
MVNAEGTEEVVPRVKAPDGTTSERVSQVARCFVNGGMQAPILSDIRSEIWLKLWGNLAFNPISALSRATLADICQYPPRTNTPTPHIDTAYALTKLLARTLDEKRL